MQDELAFAYLLRCRNGSLYAGWTDDLAARLHAHKSGAGARYTRGFGAAGLAWAQLLPGKSEAMRREAALKKLPKAQKEALAAAWQADMRPRLALATPADAADILDVYGWYVRNSTATFACRPPALGAYQAFMAATARACPFLVARGGQGQLLGFAYAHPWHEREAFHWDVETTIYCSPAACGTGTAGPLYTALLALLRAQGYWNAYALIADPNPASEAFHARFGFVCEGRSPRTGYKLGRWVGLSTWALPLKKGRTAPGPVLPPLAGEAAACILQAAQGG